MASSLASLMGEPRAQLDPLVSSFFAYFDTQAGLNVGRLQIVQVRAHRPQPAVHATSSACMQENPQARAACKQCW